MSERPSPPDDGRAPDDDTGKPPDAAATSSTLERSWRRLAERVGGEFHRGVSGMMPAVQKRELDWTLTLERVQTEAGVRTRLLAPFRNPDGFRFAVRDEGLFDDLWKTLGFLQDLEVGDAAFDRRFLVKGRPAERVRELLDDRVRELLTAQPYVWMGVAATPPGYPLGAFRRGVDALYFQEGDEIVGVERLAGLFDLFSALLSRLRPASHAHADDPDWLRKRLLEPGGRIERPYSPLVIWDGDRPRRYAAERLGRLGASEAVPDLVSALGEDDDGLVAAAARALARIGDERAVPPLFGLLGEREREWRGGSVADHAAEALEHLGHGPGVEAFRSALAGDPEALPAAVTAHRAEVVQALMRVVDSADFSARAHAARALGVLGANEALPLLRSKSSAWGMRTRLTEAAREAVERIEARASLPRPAGPSPDEPDTHPRPAGDPGPDAGTLPRSVERDDGAEGAAEG